jgi:16S rRNA pseudouridine516 synthase
MYMNKDAFCEVHMELMRLEKIIADTGLASRREAAQLIKNGFVLVDGRLASSGADKYDPAQTVISVNGKPLSYKKKHYLMMNKPAGYVSATEDRSEQTVNDLLEGVYARLDLFPAGRLDKDAEGLLLLTDDGDFAHRIITPSKKVYKTYFVETDGALCGEDAAAFENSLVLKDGLVCLPAHLNILTSGVKSTAYVIIHEGKYHQVKRMLASLGKPVTYLKRVAIGGLKLDENLAAGAYRELTDEETEVIFFDAESRHDIGDI